MSQTAPNDSAPHDSSTATQPPQTEKVSVDIEQVPVDDDPRQWSRTRKMITLWIVSVATMISTMSSNIQTSSDLLVARDLHATTAQISWTLSIYILVQGNCPLLWSIASEMAGRKPVYIIASVIFIIGGILAAFSRTFAVFLTMRALQAAGSSTFLAISAATLADIYEPHERGTMMGLFYAAPLLGPALAPVLGGTLSNIFGWRANFYCLAGSGALVLAAMIFLFKDTFRRQRSLTYQTAVRNRIGKRDKSNATNAISGVANQTRKGDEEQASKEKVSQPGHENNVREVAGTKSSPATDVKLSLADVNPFPQMWQVIQRKNSLLILWANGLVFAFNYSLSYTCARVLAIQYHYDPLQIGIILLILGAGSIFGSVIGGRWSDHVVAKLQQQSGREWYAEMRLHSAKPAMLWLPVFVLGYGWAAEKHLNVELNGVMLFFTGFFAIWIYASTLAYLVDANPGRSCFAVAMNSSFRGTLAFVATEVVVPWQDTLGVGGMYTVFAGVLIIVELLILLVMYEGVSWREKCVAAEAANGANE
ncbi:MFS general substrate transporter [Pisolithus thermaeus]|nr:MFS general substrate transporter [Pisolithus thermaeus]